MRLIREHEKQRDAKLSIGCRAQDSIGRELRAVYEPFIQEPLPVEFLSLLRTWKDAETEQSGILRWFNGIKCRGWRKKTHAHTYH